jgi:hypothetical protein
MSEVLSKSQLKDRARKAARDRAWSCTKKLSDSPRNIARRAEDQSVRDARNATRKTIYRLGREALKRLQAGG